MVGLGVCILDNTEDRLYMFCPDEVCLCFGNDSHLSWSEVVHQLFQVHGDSCLWMSSRLHNEFITRRASVFVCEFGLSIQPHAASVAQRNIPRVLAQMLKLT